MKLRLEFYDGEQGRYAWAIDTLKRGYQSGAKTGYESVEANLISRNRSVAS